MTIEEACAELRKHDTLSHHGRYGDVYHCLSKEAAKEIADMLEELSRKGDENCPQ